MKITSVEVHKRENDEKMKGTVTVKIDDCFLIRDIRIIQGKDRLFVAMPSRKSYDEKYHDIAHPLNEETRKMFEDAILAEYNKIEKEEE